MAGNGLDRRAALQRASSAALPLFAPLFSFFGRPSAAVAAASGAAADAASEAAMFYSGATGKENYMTAFTASSASTCSTVCERRKFPRHCGIESDALKRRTDLRPVRSSPVI